MASFTVSPTTAVKHSQLTATVTGTATSWTQKTLFTVTGGTGPSIKNVYVDVVSQVATFILDPGTASGTLTLHNSTDGATATVTVALGIVTADEPYPLPGLEPSYKQFNEFITRPGNVVVVKI